MAEATESVVAETDALPKTIVRRVVKEKLSQLATDSEISVLRDSYLAFSESARIFIHYLSSTANDICKEANRQTINAEDVFKALEEMEFPEFIEPLRDSLQDFRKKNSGKKQSKAKDSNTKEKQSNAKESSTKGKQQSNAKESNTKGKQPNTKESNTKGKQSNAKDTNTKAKRKEPPSPAPSAGRSKRQEVENGDGDSSD